MLPPLFKQIAAAVCATPDERRSTEPPALELHYISLPGCCQILDIEGDRKPRYEITWNAFSGDRALECYVKLIQTDTKIAIIDYQSVPAKIEIKFTERNHNIDIKGSLGPLQASRRLAELHWEPTEMGQYEKFDW